MRLLAAVSTKPEFGNLLQSCSKKSRNTLQGLYESRCYQRGSFFCPYQNPQGLLKATLSERLGSGTSIQKPRALLCRNSQAATNGSVTDVHNDSKPDAIFILAGGQTQTGGVPIWVERRLDSALLEYERHNRTIPLVCMGGGTPYRPPILSQTGQVIHEGTSLAQYLLSKGVPPEHVYKEWGSYDTVANAYFALLWHAIPARWSNLVVVTSEFHMPRSRLLFEWVFGLEGARGSKNNRTNNNNNNNENDGMATIPGTSGVNRNGYTLRFLSSSDAGIDSAIIQPRVEKETSSIDNVKKLMARIRTLEDFHYWFHMEHKAYNVADQHNFGQQSTNNPALASY